MRTAQSTDGLNVELPIWCLVSSQVLVRLLYSPQHSFGRPSFSFVDCEEGGRSRIQGPRHKYLEKAAEGA